MKIKNIFTTISGFVITSLVVATIALGGPIQVWQVVTQAAMNVLGFDTRTKLELVIPAIDNELNSPLRMYGAVTPDTKLYIESNKVTIGNGSSRTTPPDEDLVNTFVASTIDYSSAAVTGGTIEVDGSTFALPTCTAGQFRRHVLTYESKDNKIDSTFSIEAATEGALENPGALLSLLSGLSLGYIDLECVSTGVYKTAASGTSVIENGKITVFGSGVGGGGGLVPEVQTSNFTAQNGKHYLLSSAVTAITMPVIGGVEKIAFSKIRGDDWSTTPVTFTKGGTDTILGFASYIYNTNDVDVVTLVADLTNTKWEILTTHSPETKTGEVNYLIAGGVNGDGENSPFSGANALGWSSTNGGIISPGVVTSALRGNSSLNLEDGTATNATIFADFELPVADENRLLKLSFDLRNNGTYSSGDFKVEIIRDPGGDDEALQLTTSDIPASQGLFTTTWSSQGSETYRIRFSNTTGAIIALANGISIDNIIIGSGKTSLGATVTEWKTYTPTTNGLGTISGELQWRRIGGSIEVQGEFTNGTVTASEARIHLPNGYTIDWLGASAVRKVAGQFLLDGTTARHFVLLATHGELHVEVGNHIRTSDTNMMAPIDGSPLGSSSVVTVRFSVPVTQFSGSGTVNLINDDMTSSNASSKWKVTDTTPGSGTTIDFDTVNSTYTNVGVWANTNGSITIPADGKYTITANVAITGTFSVNNVLGIQIGGSQKAQFRSGTGVKSILGSTTLDLSKGDLVTIELNVAPTLDSDEFSTYLEITRQQDFSAGQPVGFGFASTDNAGLVKKNKWQRRDLVGTITATAADVSSLRFANLVVGNTYRVSADLKVTITGTSATESVVLRTEHNGATLIEAVYRHDAGTDVREVSALSSTIFVATTTTVVFDVDISGTSTVQAETFTMLEELNNYEAESSEFTP